MSASANPDIVDDGLVFLYDTDDGKSYKGEPTTNVMADPLPTAGWGVSNYLSSTATRTYSSENGIPHMEITNVNVDGSYPRINMANLTSTITDGFSISFEAKSSVADAQLYFALYSSGSTKTSQLATLSTEWQRFKFENLTTGFTLDDGYLRFPSSADSGTVYYIRRMQVEQKSHATPFVNGTRSATQGLIDRTGNTTIDLSNVSFDSNAQMTAFDGTDDYISLSQNVTVPAVGFTVMMAINVNDSQSSSSWNYWFKQTANDGHKYEFGCYGTNGNQFQFKDNIIGSSSVVATLNSSEFTILHFGSTSSSYSFYSKNGESKVLSNSSSGWTGGDDINFSEFFRTGSSYFGAKAINMLIYNKELSQKEILQNFNATKSRFGL